MPAKTVKDLVELNEGLKTNDKVYVRIASPNQKKLTVQFVHKNGSVIYQNDEARERYYGVKIHKDTLGYDPGSEGGIKRLNEPISSKPMFPWGSASCKYNTNKNLFHCHGAWFVGLTESAKGWGPMLYDCLLATLGQYNIGLAPDRELVSDQAMNIWINYYEKRPDVLKKEMDLDVFRQKRKFSGDESADCWEKHDTSKEWNKWLVKPELDAEKSDQEKHEKKLKRHETAVKAANHVYFDNGIKTLDELRNSGYLIEKYSIKTDENVAILYSSFIFDAKQKF